MGWAPESVGWAQIVFFDALFVLYEFWCIILIILFISGYRDFILHFILGYWLAKLSLVWYKAAVVEGLVRFHLTPQLVYETSKLSHHCKLPKCILFSFIPVSVFQFREKSKMSIGNFQGRLSLFRINVWQASRKNVNAEVGRIFTYHSINWQVSRDLRDWHKS